MTAKRAIASRQGASRQSATRSYLINRCVLCVFKDMFLKTGKLLVAVLVVGFRGR